MYNGTNSTPPIWKGLCRIMSYCIYLHVVIVLTVVRRKSAERRDNSAVLYNSCTCVIRIIILLKYDIFKLTDRFESKMKVIAKRAHTMKTAIIIVIMRYQNGGGQNIVLRAVEFGRKS